MSSDGFTVLLAIIFGAIFTYRFRRYIPELALISGAFFFLVFPSVENLDYVLGKNMEVAAIMAFVYEVYIFSMIMITVNLWKRNNRVVKIQQILRCSDKVVARYLGFKPLSREFILFNTYRLNLLFEIAKKLEQEKIEVETSHKALATPSYPLEDGWEIDTLTAIHLEKPEAEVMKIFNHNLKEVRK